MAELSSDSADIDDKQLLRCVQHPVWDLVDAEFRWEHHDLTTTAPVSSGCRSCRDQPDTQVRESGFWFGLVRLAISSWLGSM